MSEKSTAGDLGWLVDSFVERVAGVEHAVVVSSDGLVLAASANLVRDDADRFAAVASGLVALANGAAQRFDAGHVNEVIVEMDRAFVFVTGIGGGSALAVMAAADSDPGFVGYEMALLGERVGAALTPALRGSGVR